jgi:dTDP-4-dehydrorhamnose 3,5-epimerase
MKFTETVLKDAFIVEPVRLEDERGFFARTFCQNEFREHGLSTTIAQCNVSFNHRRGTLRGMHYQVVPKAEDKFVICIGGAIFDVMIDLREGSPTWGRWVGVELSGENRRMLYVPKGFAHGYQTLTDNASVLYQVSEFYSPEHERGLRWDDPAFGIQWPIDAPILSEKDASHPYHAK